MRVGLVCPYALEVAGGVQNHVLGLAAYLRDAGHDPHVLAPGGLPDEAAGLDATHFTSAGDAVPLRYNGSVARVSFGPLSAARARRWCATGGFDLVHVHEPVTPSVALLALWATDAPVVATFHTATPRSRTMRLAGAALAAAVDKIDAGIAVSEVARDVVVRHLGRDAMIIPNGFPLAAYALPAAPAPVGRWRGGDRPRVVFLGRLDEPRKGLDVLLAALPALRRARPDLDVVVAGQGRRALPPWCRSVGALDEGAKAALLASADVFVAPHTERESFGIVLLEAMASGAPVVASDLAPFADLVAGDDRDTAAAAGHLFRSGDPDALAASVLGVLAHPSHPETERARVLVRRYDWGVVGASVLAVYHAVLAAASAAPVDGTWVALDRALVARAERAAAVAARPGVDPASALLVADAASAALVGLDRPGRERAESDLTQVLHAVALPGLDEAGEQVALARRLHNDAVVRARSAAVPTAFEMAEQAPPSH